MTIKNNRPEQAAFFSADMTDVSQANSLRLSQVQAGTALRRQAEEIARENAALTLENPQALSLEETQQMLHELRVHQIELEMQNDELRLAQVEINITRARYFDLYDMAPVGYCTLSEKGLIREANLTAATLLGLTRAELVNQQLSRFIFDEDQTLYYLHRKYLSETGKSQASDLRMVKNDGTAFWAHLESTEAQNVDGIPVWRFVMSDITNRKLAEAVLQRTHDGLERQTEALLESEERYKSLYQLIRLLCDNVPDMIWAKDMENRFIFVNQAHTRLLNARDTDEPIGKTDMYFAARERAAHPDQPDWHTLGEICADSDAVTMSTEIARRFDESGNVKGRFLFLDVHKAPFRDEQGLMIGTVGCGRDVTREKQLEAEHRQMEAEKMEFEVRNRQLQKVESLGLMAGAIAHHFNNQLHVVMGNLEVTMDDLPWDSAVLETLTEALKAVHKAAEVSGLMLTYLGQTPRKHEPIDLSKTCRQSLSLLQTVIPNKVTLAPEIPSPGPTICADAGQIQQILTNLVTNAWEAVGENNGTIRLTVETVSLTDIPALKRFPIDWQPKESVYACLKVADTGCGITNTDIEKLFDPFFTTKFTGRGLGLSVVIGIVQAHSGGVTVESEPGRGSIFRVFLPISTEELPCQPDLPAMSVQTGKTEKISRNEGGGAVLLIEDEEPVRNMAKMMLTRLGYMVIEAKDGDEGLERFKQHQDEIRCVLSDLTMPRMNGWETIAALRKLSPDIPVILSSGYDEALVMADEHTERPNSFLGKPYQPKSLGYAIRRAVYGSDWHG